VPFTAEYQYVFRADNVRAGARAVVPHDRARSTGARGASTGASGSSTVHAPGSRSGCSRRSRAS
jgi:hypothetical protein